MSLVVSAPFIAIAQDDPIEQLDLSKQLNQWYDSLAGQENPILLQGKMADMERKILGSHPYLGKLEWLLGDVTFRNNKFQSVPLLFNLEKDALLVLRSGQNYYEMTIELKSDLVSEFKIQDSKFIKMAIPESGKAGFYEVLFEGDKLKFYARRDKQLIKNGFTGFEYVQSDQYFLLYKDEYYVIRNKGSLARLFKKDRKLIKSFANRTNIGKLNNETDKYFTVLIAYCDSLDL